MKLKTIIYFFLCFLFFRNVIHAQSEIKAISKLIIEENKNQWPLQVLYAAEIPGGNIFFEKHSLTYLLSENVDFHHIVHNRNESIVFHQHAWKVNFEEANPAVKLEGQDVYSFHYNYYRGNNPSNWAENVKLFKGLVYKDIYTGIDINYYNNEEHIKFDFIVNPNADFKKIQMHYEGIEEMFIKNGNLHLNTSVGEVIEQKPYAYQQINGKKIEVPCIYVLKNKLVSFKLLAKYNVNFPLIIDPVLIASTYTGSTADNWGFTATYDQSGNIYTGGIAAAAGYPTSTGAFQTTFGGGGAGGNNYPFDISITKYNPTGTAILFSTYYGGKDNEQPHSLIVNGAGELFVAGRTYSSNFPTTSGSYDQSHNGGSDIIVGKFSASGSLIASTFVGGSADDGVNATAGEFSFLATKFNYADDGRSEIILDNAGNVCISGSTASSNFPTTTGAYDASLGGVQDGCLIKFNAGLSNLLLSTFIGGSSHDAAYGIKVDGNNDIYVTGGTCSNDFPTTPGVLHTNYQGGTVDGFISVFNSTGTSLLRSTFIGTSAYDQSFFLERDVNNDIYILGQTMGAYPVSVGVYSNPNSAQFIHKLNSSLTTTLFSTVIGTGSSNPNISPTAFLVDSCQSIYLSGWGRCASLKNPSANTVQGMPITPNAQQSNTDGCDFYFMVLTPNAKSLWYATYFGEVGGVTADHVDGGTSRFDRRGFIYQSVCASCGGGQSFPTTPTAWSTSNKSSNCNNAVLKMDVSLKPHAKANVVGMSMGCAPLTVQLNNVGTTGAQFYWNFGDGSPLNYNSTVSHTYNSIGSYTVTLTAIDTIGICKMKDSIKVVVKVGNPPILQMTHVDIKCAGMANGIASVTASGGYSPYSYTWTPSNQTASTINGLTAGTYTVAVNDSLGCSSTANVTINEPPKLFLSILDSTAVSCFGMKDGTATGAGGGGTGSLTYSWNTLPIQYGTQAIGLPAGEFILTLTDAMGCQIEKHVEITQKPDIIVSDTLVPTSCGVSDGSIKLVVSGGTGPYTYHWSTVPVQTSVFINGLGVGKYTVIVTDSKGCSKTFSDSIRQGPPPNADFVYSPHFITTTDPLVSFTNTSTGNIIAWDWNFGDPRLTNNNTSIIKNPSHEYSDTGKYCITLIITDKGKVCKDTVVKCLEIVPEFTFYVPNAFTPNKDGRNEYFTGYGTYISEFHLYIFDRWGSLIFETTDINLGWDGKVAGGSSGEVAQEDVYIWKINVKSIFGKKYNYIGRVTLVR